MKKEGWKFMVAMVSLVLMFVVGIILVRPFPWLQADEVKLEGEISIGDNIYTFQGDGALIVDNIRKIQGFAASENGRIFFDTQGAEVKIDQIGYLYGNMIVEGYGLVELGLDYGREVMIDEAGNMSGKFTVGEDKYEFIGKTDWRPYELAEIQVSSTMKVDVGSKSMIDPKILGLGGRDLYDVQIVYESNNENVTVDEYGYVEAKKEGTFRNAVTVTVGDKQKAITLQAVERITDIEVTPNVVVKDSDPSLTVTIDPASLVGEVSAIALVKGADEQVVCGSVSNINPGAGTLAVRCNLAGEGVGSWNVVVRVDSGEEYVFLSKLNILDAENPLNLTLVTNVMEPNTEGTAYQEKDGMTVVAGNEIEYFVIVDFPSFLEESEITTGTFDITFSGRGSSDRCVVDTADTDPRIITGTFSQSDIDDDGRLDLGSMVYNGVMPQGCDLVAKLSFRDVAFDNGLTGIRGTAEASSGIKSAKQVLLRGDVLVQEGNLEVEALHSSANMFTLVAGDEVETSVTGEGNVSDYGLSEDAQFNQVLEQIQTNIQKLVIERAIPSGGSLDDIENELKIFTVEDKAKNPEGRIIYNGDPVGPLYIGGAGDVEVCGPVTLVVEGRDVIIQDNIVKAQVSYPCSAEGNFGLIVINGDIKFAGDPNPVENVMGYYFTTGTMYTGESHAKFTLSGVSIAHDYVLQRY